MAMQVLIGAGMPEEAAMQLYQVLMQNQGGPGNEAQNPPQQGQPAQGGGQNAAV
jgi:hypothetical protein